MHNPALHFDHLNPPASSFKVTNVFAGFFCLLPPVAAGLLAEVIRRSIQVLEVPAWNF